MFLYKIEKLVAKSSHSGIQNVTLNPIPRLPVQVCFYTSASLMLCSGLCDFQDLSLVPDKLGEGERWPRDGFELAFQKPASGQMVYLDPVPH